MSCTCGGGHTSEPSCSLLDDCFLDAVDCGLEARDITGMLKAKVQLVTRTWQGETVGRGDFTDDVVDVYPTLNVKDLSWQRKLNPTGNVNNGDIMLKGISMKRYPYVCDVDNSSPGKSAYVERFYLVDGKLYKCVNVTKQYATWDVTVRQLSSQQPYTDGRIA